MSHHFNFQMFTVESSWVKTVSKLWWFDVQAKDFILQMIKISRPNMIQQKKFLDFLFLVDTLTWKYFHKPRRWDGKVSCSLVDFKWNGWIIKYGHSDICFTLVHLFPDFCCVYIWTLNFLTLFIVSLQKA